MLVTLLPTRSRPLIGAAANYLDGNGCDPFTRTYTKPQPSVWEFVVEARRTSPQLENPYDLEAAVAR